MMTDYIIEEIDLEELAYLIEYEQYLMAMKYERQEDAVEL